MATLDVRRTVIGIVNEVERKLGINETTNANYTAFGKVLVDFLNDVIDECNDFGDWPQMFREATICAAPCATSIEVSVSAQVQHIYEVHHTDNVAPLENRRIEDIRRLQKTSGFGIPRQFSVVDTSGVNPRIRFYPLMSTAASSGRFDVAYYKKNRLYATTTADSTAIPAFPSRMLVQGVYAKALLEESGQEGGRAHQMAYQEYMRMRSEALNRFRADTGTDVRLVPTGRY